jgi:hypothetical protein
MSRTIDIGRLKPEQPVHLRADVPERGLRRGEVGVVCSRWLGPTPSVEVEFICTQTGETVRVIVEMDQIEEDRSDESQRARVASDDVITEAEFISA